MAVAQEVKKVVKVGGSILWKDTQVQVCSLMHLSETECYIDQTIYVGKGCLKNILVSWTLMLRVFVI